MNLNKSQFIYLVINPEKFNDLKGYLIPDATYKLLGWLGIDKSNVIEYDIVSKRIVVELSELPSFVKEEIHDDEIDGVKCLSFHGFDVDVFFTNNYLPKQKISKWDSRFLELAEFISKWSKDKSTKTGAVVIGPDREIRATGYNGLCRGVDDNMPERQERPTKYEFFEHAERNAVYNSSLTGTSLKGCTMYCTYAPCTDCARAIIQSGIKRVVTHAIDMTNAPTGTWRDKLDYSRQMFKEAGVEYVEL